jgi:hypothetical protein
MSDGDALDDTVNSEASDGLEIKRRRCPEPMVNTKGVSFHSVKTRTYKVALCHSPGVTKGPPISLAWSFVEEQHEAVDEFEFKRTLRAEYPKKLKLGNDERVTMLLNRGYSGRQVKEAIAKSKKV